MQENNEMASRGSRLGSKIVTVAIAILVLLILVQLWKTLTNLLGIQSAPAALFGQFTTLVLTAVLIWRVVLAVKHRPIPPCGDDRLPFITVIVPAYNEGAQVRATLLSLARSDYPHHRMRIIAVNDGSTDSTLEELRRAACELSGRVQVVHYSRNRGKRYALHRGIALSRGEVIVTVDSDSEVRSDTLRHLVSPFVRDHRVGAVAGNVRVLNRQAGVIPRMLDVVFAWGFDFIRAGQSEVNTVMCTPGALSAYRRRVVLAVLDDWLHQTFCGRPANIGEDRAMTNLILRAGYHVLFQRDAVVYTEVPTRFPKLCRMLLRWARSNIRETLIMSRFAFRRFRSTGSTGARINLILSWVGLVSPLWWSLTVILLPLHPSLSALNLVLGASTGALLPMTFYLVRRRCLGCLWALPYGLYSLLLLSWITPYALLTPHRTGWLTRGSGEAHVPTAVPLLPLRTDRP